MDFGTLGILNICRNNKRRQTIVLGTEGCTERGSIPSLIQTTSTNNPSLLLTQSGHISPPEWPCPGNSACGTQRIELPTPYFYAHTVWGVGW
ncbi:hypothetical protein CEXT_704041 [Caerostris extrusa]|uniref:Uncharacterized protein n=1 Tax=Caerostris extrusa TaxID=172846 RepID=A0AAV4TLV5_CAEEX|nr:hypothetical protein CEXT_704041 [Caerostris extrusa]